MKSISILKLPLSALDSAQVSPMNDVCSTCLEDATYMFDQGFPKNKFYQYRDGCVSCAGYSVSLYALGICSIQFGSLDAVICGFYRVL